MSLHSIFTKLFVICIIFVGLPSFLSQNREHLIVINNNANINDTVTLRGPFSNAERSPASEARDQTDGGRVHAFVAPSALGEMLEDDADHPLIITGKMTHPKYSSSISTNISNVDENTKENLLDIFDHGADIPKATSVKNHFGEEHPAVVETVQSATLLLVTDAATRFVFSVQYLRFSKFAN